MEEYFMNEAAFALPREGEARDWTSHVLRMRQGGHPMMLAVNRGPIPVGKSLRQLAQLRVVDEYRRFRGYAVLDERETSWAGQPAVELSSRWRDKDRVIYEEQAHLALGERWIFFTVGAPIAGRAEVAACLAHLRETFRPRSDLAYDEVGASR
jgi:hypothetical protein